MAMIASRQVLTSILPIAGRGTNLQRSCRKVSISFTNKIFGIITMRMCYSISGREGLAMRPSGLSIWVLEQNNSMMRMEIIIKLSWCTFHCISFSIVKAMDKIF